MPGERFFRGIAQAEVLPMNDASHPANTGTDWGKEGAVSEPWDQCAALGHAVGNISPGHRSTCSLAD